MYVAWVSRSVCFGLAWWEVESLGHYILYDTQNQPRACPRLQSYVHGLRHHTNYLFIHINDCEKIHTETVYKILEFSLLKDSEHNFERTL